MIVKLPKKMSFVCMKSRFLRYRIISITGIFNQIEIKLEYCVSSIIHLTTIHLVAIGQNFFMLQEKLWVERQHRSSRVELNYIFKELR